MSVVSKEAKRVLDPLELKLQAVVRCQMWVLLTTDHLAVPESFLLYIFIEIEP